MPEEKGLSLAVPENTPTVCAGQQPVKPTEHFIYACIFFDVSVGRESQEFNH